MKKTMVLILSLLMTTVSFSQTDLTLENSIQIALQRNSALVKANYNLESSKASVKSAYGNLIPTLGVSASWGWGKTEGNLGTSAGASSYRVNAGGSVVLFDGLANYANISSAEDDFEAAELGIDRFKRDIVQTTTIFYYTILKSKALLKVKEENFKYNNKLLETITERNKIGSAPVADLYAQQVQAGGAEVEMIIAQNSVDAAQNTLIDYLSLDVLKEYNFVSKIDTVNDSNIEYYNKDFNDILTMVDYALLNRTDYLGQQKTLSSASEGITVAKGGFWPSLSGDYGVGNTDIAIDDVFNQRTWSVGLSVNFPIFSNFNTETSVQYAKVNELNAQEDLLALEREIKIDIKQGYLDFKAVSKALEVSIKTVISASENRRVQYERYSLGSGTFLDVLQSDRDYQNSLSLRIDAEFNFHSAREALLNSIGKLDYKKYESSKQ